MSKNSKFVSKLDLKFLDLKFLTIDDPRSLSSIHCTLRNRNRQAESLDFPSIHQDRGVTTDAEIVDSLQQSCLQNLKPLVNSGNSRNKQNRRSKKCDTNAKTNVSTLEQKDAVRSEIQKYRQKINRIKKENEVIHSEIAELYHNKEVNRDKDLQVKKVRNLEIYREKQASSLNFEKKSIKVSSKFKNGATVNIGIIGMAGNANLNDNAMGKSKSGLKKQNFYENICASSNKQYQEELEKLKEKFVSSNLHKNFQQYLVNKNKRVPQFLKRIV